MRKLLRIAAAYVATIATIPLLFLAADQVWRVPSPLGMRFASLFDLYVIMAFLAFMVALPGFVLARLVLWQAEARSIGAFAVAGALAGMISAVLVCLPDFLWGLWQHNLLTLGAVIGSLAGAIYRLIEAALFKGFLSPGQPLILGDNRK